MPEGRRFIRSVNFKTSPNCLVATHSQLCNVAKFCTSPGPHCVWEIDPMFNMGKFYVTVTTYPYSHVVRKGSTVPVAFFDPIFVHTEKTLESYYYWQECLECCP